MFNELIDQDKNEVSDFQKIKNRKSLKKYKRSKKKLLKSEMS